MKDISETLDIRQLCIHLTYRTSLSCCRIHKVKVTYIPSSPPCDSLLRKVHVVPTWRNRTGMNWDAAGPAYDASAVRGGFAAAAKLHASTVLSSLSNASFATLCVYARLERRHFSFYTWDHVAGQCDLPRRSFRLKVHLRCSFAALSTLNEY